MEVATEAIALDDPADVGAVRRRFAVLAAHAGLDETRVGDAALIATELASNVLKHAGHGGALLAQHGPGVTIAVWDKGPGMDLAACLRDGMSTAGTGGNGLGAVARIASSWDAYTPQGRGSVIVAHVAPRGAASRSGFRTGAVCVPYPGLTVCGDAWATHEQPGVLTAIVCDGLGHGDGAAEAASAIIASFRTHATEDLAELIRVLDRAATPTRGAAGTLVRLDRGARTVTVAGVGNVGVWIVGEAPKQLATQHGTLGQVLPTPREERHPWPPGALVILCSDGLKSRLVFDPALAQRDPATIAAALWRDHARGSDDATVLVLAEQR